MYILIMYLFLQIGIIPLISGSINIYIKLKSNDITQEIYRNIQIHSIEPQVFYYQIDIVNKSLNKIFLGYMDK